MDARKTMFKAIISTFRTAKKNNHMPGRREYCCVLKYTGGSVWVVASRSFS